MPTYIALLRGINITGRNMLAMANLRAFITSLGCANVCTLLQSGNLAFQTTSRKSTAALETWLEKESEARFKMPISYLLRTADELNALIEANPFPNEAIDDPSHLLVMFCRTAPAPAALEKLEAAIKGRERFIAKNRELYITYPDGIGTSKFTHTLIEKILSARCTGRNWNTVLKLQACATDPKPR